MSGFFPPARTWSRAGYEISTAPERLDIEFVHRELKNSYWSPNIPRGVVENALCGSLVFGLYRQGGEQVGFARLVTDSATFAYLCDVVIADAERGKGLGRWLNECVITHPDLQGLRRWVLATRDAHGLYHKTGWSPLKTPDKFMERNFPNIYQTPADSEDPSLLRPDAVGKAVHERGPISRRPHIDGGFSPGRIQ